MGTLHDRLNNVTANTLPNITIDGVSCGLIYQKRRIEWWAQSAENFDELSEWYDNAVAHLDALFHW